MQFSWTLWPCNVFVFVFYFFFCNFFLFGAVQGKSDYGINDQTSQPFLCNLFGFNPIPVKARKKIKYGGRKIQARPGRYLMEFQ